MFLQIATQFLNDALQILNGRNFVAQWLGQLAGDAVGRYADMGLTITRSIVESYRGRVWATANQGTGATFSFTLPGKTEA